MDCSSKSAPIQPTAFLFVYYEHDAVIKMIIKCRSPTMRHLSKTHRVNLDRLFDRIKLGSSSAKLPNKSKARVTQLTHLFSSMTPHLRTCSHRQHAHRSSQLHLSVLHLYRTPMRCRNVMQNRLQKTLQPNKGLCVNYAPITFRKARHQARRISGKVQKDEILGEM